jgi:hypothetical protein
MDEIFNWLSSPGWWFSSIFVAVVVNIISNKLDKLIPAISMAWARGIIWSFLVLSSFLLVLSITSHFHPPIAPNISPVLELDEKGVFAAFLYASILYFASFPICPPITKFPVTAKRLQIFSSILVLALYAFSVIFFASARGWNDAFYQQYSAASAWVGYVIVIACLLMGIYGLIDKTREALGAEDGPKHLPPQKPHRTKRKVSSS